MLRIWVMAGIIESFYPLVRVGRKKKAAVCGIYYLVNCALYLLLRNPLVNLLVTMLGLCAVGMLYTRKIYAILVTGIVTYMLAAIAETLTVTVFTSFESGNFINHFYDLITIVILWMFKLLVVNISHIDKWGKSISKWILFIIPFFSIIIILLLYMFDFTVGIKNAAFFSYLAIINILVAYLYHSVAAFYEQKYEYELLKQRVENYAYHMDVIAESEERVRMLRHDLKHHMNEINLMARKEDTRAIQEYLNRMKEYVDNPNEIITSGNKEIDSLLNYMLIKAKKVLHRVDASIQIPENLKHSFDVNIIIGNLMENAIEAASQTQEKMISINVKYVQGLLHIDISNSYKGNLKKQGNNLLTTKGDMVNHGIGLKSVKRVIEKYNGNIEIKEKEHIVYMFVTLYI